MFTTTYTVDNITRVKVTAHSYCRTIRIYENALAATQNFLVAEPAATGTQVTKAAGTSYAFTAPGIGMFQPGDVVGDVIAAAGSITMAQEETGASV